MPSCYSCVGLLSLSFTTCPFLVHPSTLNGCLPLKIILTAFCVVLLASENLWLVNTFLSFFCFSFFKWNPSGSSKNASHGNSMCGALHDLVPFVQFKKQEKHPWRIVNFTCNFTKINIPPWVFFAFFKSYKWYQIAQRITYFYAVLSFSFFSFHLDISLAVLHTPSYHLLCSPLSYKCHFLSKNSIF